jgi:hypothetical protein
MNREVTAVDKNPNECVCGYVGEDRADLETHIAAQAVDGDRDHGHRWIIGYGGVTAKKPSAGTDPA